MVSRAWKRFTVVGSAGVYSPNGTWGEPSCALDRDSGNRGTEPPCHSQSADDPLSCACSGTSCGIVCIETDNSHLKIIQLYFNNLYSCTNLLKPELYKLNKIGKSREEAPTSILNQSLSSPGHLPPVAHLTYVIFKG